MPFLRVFSSVAVLSDHTGVEQLSSLQHLDLAYNLLLEHSQLAPLSLLHCLNTVRTHTCSRTHADVPAGHFGNIVHFLVYETRRLNAPPLLLS